MNLKPITFLTLVLSSIIYFGFSGPTFAGAWKRVQQCDSWDQVNSFLTKRIADLQGNVDLRGSDLDMTRLTLWEARQKVALHLQEEVRSPEPQTLKLMLGSINSFEEVAAAKEAKRTAIRRATYAEIPDAQYPLGASRTYGTVVTEPDFYGGEVAGPIYRLPLDNDPKGKSPADTQDTSLLFDDGAPEFQAAILASLGLENSSDATYYTDQLGEDLEEAAVRKAIALSLEDQGGASSSSETLNSSLPRPTFPPAQYPYDGINLDDLDFDEL